MSVAIPKGRPSFGLCRAPKAVYFDNRRLSDSRMLGMHSLCTTIGRTLDSRSAYVSSFPIPRIAMHAEMPLKDMTTSTAGYTPRPHRASRGNWMRESLMMRSRGFVRLRGGKYELSVIYYTYSLIHATPATAIFLQVRLRT